MTTELDDLKKQVADVPESEPFVSCADIAMGDFVVTEKDAAEMRRLIATGEARPRMAISDDHVIIEAGK